MVSHESVIYYEFLTSCGLSFYGIIWTYFCGWEGSSPSETVSPGMSLKHFWQKLYLSENKAGVGFLKNIDN